MKISIFFQGDKIDQQASAIGHAKIASCFSSNGFCH
jgi:hypothetical protein